MKKVFFGLVATIAIVSITSCGKDEDTSDCCSQTTTIGGTSTTVQYCKKDDNTVTLTSNGTSVDVPTTGTTADEFMKTVRAAGCK